jgi:hypothetical protein
MENDTRVRKWALYFDASEIKGGCVHTEKLREEPYSSGLLLCNCAITNLQLSHVAGEYFTFVMTWIPSRFCFPSAKYFWHERGVLVLMNLKFQYRAEHSSERYNPTVWNSARTLSQPYPIHIWSKTPKSTHKQEQMFLCRYTSDIYPYPPHTISPKPKLQFTTQNSEHMHSR